MDACRCRVWSLENSNVGGRRDLGRGNGIGSPIPVREAEVGGGLLPSGGIAAGIGIGDLDRMRLEKLLGEMSTGRTA